MAAGLAEAEESWGSWSKDGKSAPQQDDSHYLDMGHTLEGIAAWRQKRKAQRQSYKERKKQRGIIEKEWIVVASSDAPVAQFKYFRG